MSSLNNINSHVLPGSSSRRLAALGTARQPFLMVPSPGFPSVAIALTSSRCDSDHRITANSSSVHITTLRTTLLSMLLPSSKPGAPMFRIRSQYQERVQQINLSHTWTLNPNTSMNFASLIPRGPSTFLHPEAHGLGDQFVYRSSRKALLLYRKNQHPKCVDITCQAWHSIRNYSGAGCQP